MGIDIKTFMAAAVIALTAACAETPSVQEAAGPAADEALEAAKQSEEVTKADTAAQEDSATVVVAPPL